MHTIVKALEEQRLRKDIPDFVPGDSLKVHIKLVEGERERIQVFEGDVIRIRRGNLRANFTIRKISFGVGVERIIPFHSPSIHKIEVIRKGKVRRAKLYYMRQRVGKKARIKEKKVQ